MLTTPRSKAAAGIVLLVLVAAAVLTGYFLTHPKAAAASGTASLTVFTGETRVEKAGTTGFTLAKTGQQLSSGDQVRTEADTKAAITFPDGSVTRLDSNTQLTVKVLARATNGGVTVDLEQTAGKTWNNVKQLAGGGSFKVHGPNSTTATKLLPVVP